MPAVARDSTDSTRAFRPPHRGPALPAEALVPVAQRLIDHHSLLASLCRGGSPTVPLLLGKLQLSPAVRALLTSYAESRAGRLEHAVGVAVIAVALARRMFPTEPDQHRMLAIAGLLHDVGELYMDPQMLQPGARLTPAQWRHIATHPVLGSRVLRGLDGAGEQVADAVLQHHERQDGFGYPRALQGAQLTLQGQILGAAEWLMGLVEAGMGSEERASVAARLMPGEFSAELIDVIASTRREGRAAADMPPLNDAVQRMQRIAAVLERFARARAALEARLAAARAEVRLALGGALLRMARIQIAFSCTGLDMEHPELLMRKLAAMSDPQLDAELHMVVCELEWRLREVERELMLRSALIGEPTHAAVREVVGQMRA
jgi:HD-like signal output (HDOD) protein